MFMDVFHLFSLLLYSQLDSPLCTKHCVHYLGIYITFYGCPLLALFSDCGSFLPYSHILDNLNNQIGFEYSLS